MVTINCEFTLLDLTEFLSSLLALIIFIVVTVIFCHILESILHAKALRIEREQLVSLSTILKFEGVAIVCQPGRCGCGSSQDGMGLEFGSRRTSQRSSDNKWLYVRSSKTLLFSVEIA